MNKLLWVALFSMIVFSTVENNAIASTTLPIGDMSSETEKNILSISNLVKSRYLMDTSDPKVWVNYIMSSVGEIFKASNKCTPERLRTLSMAYRNLVEAVSEADAQLVWVYANGLYFHAYSRSSMYTTCWNSLVKQATMLGTFGDAALDVINVGTSGNLRWDYRW